MPSVVPYQLMLMEFLDLAVSDGLPKDRKEAKKFGLAIPVRHGYSVPFPSRLSSSKSQFICSIRKGEPPLWVQQNLELLDKFNKVHERYKLEIAAPPVAVVPTRPPSTRTRGRPKRLNSSWTENIAGKNEPNESDVPPPRLVAFTPPSDQPAALIFKQDPVETPREDPLPAFLDGVRQLLEPILAKTNDGGNKDELCRVQAENRSLKEDLTEVHALLKRRNDQSAKDQLTIAELRTDLEVIHPTKKNRGLLAEIELLRTDGDHLRRELTQHKDYIQRQDIVNESLTRTVNSQQQTINELRKRYPNEPFPYPDVRIKEEPVDPPTQPQADRVLRSSAKQ